MCILDLINALFNCKYRINSTTFGRVIRFLRGTNCVALVKWWLHYFNAEDAKCLHPSIKSNIDESVLFSNLHYVSRPRARLLCTYNVSASPKAKFKAKFSPLNAAELFSGFYEGIFHWLTGTAEQGNPSLHGLVGMTDANMLLLSPDTDTIITLTQLERERGREGERERDISHLRPNVFLVWLHTFFQGY